MKSQSRLHLDPKTGRHSFATINEVVEYPDLLNVQIESFELFLQEKTAPAKRKNRGLQQVFLQNFPITDTRENFLLEFVDAVAGSKNQPLVTPSEAAARVTVMEAMYRSAKSGRWTKV